VKLTSGWLVLGPALLPLFLFAACSGGSHGSASSAGTGGGVPEAGTPDAGDAGDAAMDAGPSFCAQLQLASRPFITTGTGPSRGDLAADFTLPLLDGTSWTFSAEATGCETYVFVPDLIPVSSATSTSIWDRDLLALVKASPENVHYFFVSQQSTDALAKTSLDAMQARVAALVATGGGLTVPVAAQWKQHLHVVSTRAQATKSWVGDALLGWGQLGFAIDRRQRLRGVGSLSDVTRTDPKVPATMWNFESNLAYVANEPIYMNAQSDELDRLDTEGATVVPVLTGGVISGDGYADVQLPSAAEMAQFDTLEVEVNMACPDPTAVELASCGPWDYIVQLFVDTPDLDAGLPVEAGPDAGVPPIETEIARFITSYARETHWVEDITPMMALLAAPGPTHLHYAYAPSWNQQPTAVTLSLRFSNQKKGYAPATLTPIASGGTFDDQYNVGRMPVSAPIPADTKHAEVWMIVTGHGSDSYQCGEFCDSEHQFTVDGASNTWLVDFPMAGTESQCIPEEKNGMVPNQGGTWWYGRDGWCPGEQVTPHVWDVTSMVTPGSTATVTYEGLFDGTTPPASGTGNIVLTSYLVTYH
jgi:Peptide-N-glycosidase F, C terminal